MRIKRPVLLLGPLVEVVAVKMEEESRNKYTRGQPSKNPQMCVSACVCMCASLL